MIVLRSTYSFIRSCKACVKGVLGINKKETGGANDTFQDNLKFDDYWLIVP